MISIRIDTHGLEQKLDQAAQNIGQLPQGPENPLSLGLKDYQDHLRESRRPTVAESGRYEGESWPQPKEQYIRKDGTVVPIYGQVKKASGKGTVKGRKKSEGTGGGVGSRYRADDLQLGARAGGLWSDWISQKPKITEEGRRATLTSPFAYAARQFSSRPWFGSQLASLLKDRLTLQVEKYIKGVLPQ